jgi:hypothetical protein
MLKEMTNALVNADVDVQVRAVSVLQAKKSPHDLDTHNGVCS